MQITHYLCYLDTDYLVTMLFCRILVPVIYMGSTWVHHPFKHCCGQSTAPWQPQDFFRFPNWSELFLATWWCWLAGRCPVPNYYSDLGFCDVGCLVQDGINKSAQVCCDIRNQQCITAYAIKPQKTKFLPSFLLLR